MGFGSPSRRLLTCALLPPRRPGLSNHTRNVQPVLGHPLANAVFLSYLFGVCSLLHLCEQQRSGQEQASGQPGGFFLLARIARKESDVAESLDLAELVLQQRVCEFVCDVALSTRRIGEWVVHDYGAVRRGP